MITKEISHLLQAGLHPNLAEQIQYWESWQKKYEGYTGDFSQLDFSPNEIRLIPFVWYVLKEQLPKDSFYYLCQGLYKKNHFVTKVTSFRFLKPLLM